jgi:hypothetical protein
MFTRTVVNSRAFPQHWDDTMKLLRAFLMLAAVGLALPAFADETKSETIDKAKAEPTHEKLTEVAIKQADGRGLQTLCADKAGRVLALVAPPRHFDGTSKSANSEIRILSADGKPIAEWKVDFHAHSLNVGPDGTVFVAGDGKVARFDKDGKVLGQIELPHIAELLKDKEGMRKSAEAQIKQQRDSFEQAKKQFTEQKEKLEKKKAEDLTKQETAQLEQFKQILKSYDQTSDYYAKMTVESVVAQTASRLKIINGIAVSEKDIFLVCGETKGYGYAIWRMTHDFKEPKQVKGSVGGCCGQMDVQVAGSDFLLAENTAYKFARYDRDGKEIGKWGKGMMVAPGKECPPDCFGGCCNPMNLRVDLAGDVYTAESEGIIKRYSAKGDFLGTVGKVPLTGGCKNVAVAVTADAERVFFCDQPGSKVIILAKKKAEKAAGGQ